MFNDGAFAALTEKETKELNQIRLEAGQPIRFGPDGERGVARAADGGLEIVRVADVGEDALLVHDPGRRDPAWPSRWRRWRRIPRRRRRSGSSDRCSARRTSAARPWVTEPGTEAELGELLHGGDTWTARGLVAGARDDRVRTTPGWGAHTGHRAAVVGGLSLDTAGDR